MKKALFIFAFMLSAILLKTNESKAAFPVKKGAVTEIATQPAPTVATIATPAPGSDNSIVQREETITRTKKHSAFSNLINKIVNPRRATAMPPFAYILLCVIALGWLAMGLNDDFGGYEWVLSLVLYILFYFPGLIYSLIMMGKYY